MIRYCFSIAFLLIGCNIAYSRSQDAMNPTDARSVLHSLAATELRAAHPLSAISRTMLNIGDHKNCVAKCNGDVLPVNDEPQFYECWDEFKSECSFSQPGASVTTTYTCHGAFTFFPGHHDEKVLEFGGMDGLHRMIDVRGDNSSLTMLSCEGNALALSESSEDVPGDDGTDSDAAVKVMSIQGAFCSGLSRIVTAKSPDQQESYLSCEDVLVSGSATKTVAAPDWSSTDGTKAELERAAKHFIDSFTAYGSSSASMDGSSAAEEEESIYEGRDPGSADEEEPDSGSQSLRLSAVDAFQLWNKKPSGCKVTCNGGSLPFRGWWPCRGRTELKCSGEGKSTTYDVHAVCSGVTYPVFKTCKGLATQHVTVNTDEVSSEIMAVIKGKSHVKQVQRHGWKGSITFADGMTSHHTRTAED